jgi:DNA-binding MarR family transcriptional regulator
VNGPEPLRVGPDFEAEFPGASSLATECVINLLHGADLILGQMTQWLRADGLSPTAGQVLAIVEGAGEPLPPHVIRERLLVTSGTMTALLDTLEKHGWVRRIAHPQDRRKLLVAITDAARDLLNRRMPQLHARERAWLAGLTSDEQAALVRALGIIQARVTALQDEPFPTGQGRRAPARPDPVSTDAPEAAPRARRPTRPRSRSTLDEASAVADDGTEDQR